MKSGIIKSHQYRPQVGVESCSREWQHCRAAAGCPFCSTCGRQLLPPPAQCGVPAQLPASSPVFQLQGATHQRFPPQWAGRRSPAFCTPPLPHSISPIIGMVKGMASSIGRSWHTLLHIHTHLRVFFHRRYMFCFS